MDWVKGSEQGQALVVGGGATPESDIGANHAIGHGGGRAGDEQFLSAGN